MCSLVMMLCILINEKKCTSKSIELCFQKKKKKKKKGILVEVNYLTGMDD